MTHTKQILVALTLLGVTSSVFAAATTVAPVATSAVTVTSTGVTTPAAATTGATVTTVSPDALNVSGAPSLVSQTATSVTLQWAKVTVAKSYVVKYSKIDVAEAAKKGDRSATYDNESDQVTATGTTISNLKTDTTYYFSVVALDAANNESATYSEQLAVKLTSMVAPTTTGTGGVATASGAVTTATTTVAPSLKLTSVSVVNEKTLTLDFSAALSSKPVTVKLTKSSDNSTVTVASVVTNPLTPTKSTVNLTAPLSTSSSYSLVIIDATDVKGLPISEGVNAVKEFATAATLSKAPVASGSGAVMPALNAAPETESGAVVAPITTTAELPPTGTQTNLLLLVAALLALGIVYGIQKKRA